MLREGDRLESIQGSCDNCLDLRKLPTGTRLEFFRPRANGRLNFLCPLTCCTDYSDVPQLAANNILGDELHTGSGGVAQYAGGCNFAIIIENAEHTLHVRARDQHQKFMRAVIELRGLLFEWYETAAGREYVHDQIRDIHLKDLVATSAL